MNSTRAHDDERGVTLSCIVVVMFAPPEQLDAVLTGLNAPAREPTAADKAEQRRDAAIAADPNARNIPALKAVATKLRRAEERAKPVTIP